jgi:glycosyltransferase involved in cell wall biosynthesis
MKPSVLIFADFPNWAYYEIQQFIKQQLSNEFDIYCDFLVFNTIKKSKNPIKRIKLFTQKYKYQHTREDNTYDIVVYLGFYFTEHMIIKWNSKKVVKGIYTDEFPPKNSNFSGGIVDFKNQFLDDADAVVFGAKMIMNRYEGFVDNLYYGSSVKDSSLFKRRKVKKINQTKSFVVGWTGNPSREFKGFYSHIVPAVELAQKKHPQIQLKTRFSGPLDSLPLFYEDVDVVLIASDADAGPSLFSEACSMEVPSISTDIGKPHEIIVDNVNGLIVEKDINEMSKKIIQLYEDRQLLIAMSSRIRNDFYDVYNVKDMANNWKEMFNELLIDK